jgi:hypothetical protein
MGLGVPDWLGLQARHGLADMVIVADVGMLSATNLRELDEADLRFIVGSRVTKAPKDLESHFRWHGDAFTDGQIIDTITPRTGHKIENDPRLSNPRPEYTSASASLSSWEEVLSTRGRPTNCGAGGAAGVLANRPACVEGPTIVAFGAAGVIPRSRTPCWSSASRRCASSTTVAARPHDAPTRH